MKIVLFGRERRIGAWVGDRIVDLKAADDRVPSRLDELIASGAAGVDLARTTIDRVVSSGIDEVTHEWSTVALHAPWPGRRIACAGGNYARHLLGMFGSRPGFENLNAEDITRQTRESAPWGFWKVPDEVAGPDAEVTFPRSSTYLDYEGEVAIVIGRRGKDIAADQLADYVWGVTLINDWSKRDPNSGPHRPMSFNSLKNFDGSTSMGPCIVVGELACDAVPVQTRVNGELRQDFSSASMIFHFGELLAHLSTDFTFVPGDVIAGGTDAGTAADTTPPGPDGLRALDRFLKVGDVVEVSSPAIGTLRNTVVAPAPQL